MVRMADHVIMRGWNKKYAGDSFERWYIAKVIMCNLENRTKPSQIIFPLGLLNKRWELGSQLDSHCNYSIPSVTRLFTWDTLKFPIDWDWF